MDERTNDFTQRKIPEKMLGFMLPMFCFISIQPDVSLTKIGIAAPAAMVFGIVINVIFYIFYSQKKRKRGMI